MQFIFILFFILGKGITDNTCSCKESRLKGSEKKRTGLGQECYGNYTIKGGKMYLN